MCGGRKLEFLLWPTYLAPHSISIGVVLQRTFNSSFQLAAKRLSSFIDRQTGIIFPKSNQQKQMQKLSLSINHNRIFSFRTKGNRPTIFSSSKTHEQNRKANRDHCIWFAVPFSQITSTLLHSVAYIRAQFSEVYYIIVRLEQKRCRWCFCRLQEHVGLAGGRQHSCFCIVEGQCKRSGWHFAHSPCHATASVATDVYWRTADTDKWLATQQCSFTPTPNATRASHTSNRNNTR